MPMILAVLFLFCALSGYAQCANDCNPFGGTCVNCHVGNCVWTSGGCWSCDGQHDQDCGGAPKTDGFIEFTAAGKMIHVTKIPSRMRQGNVILSAEGYIASVQRNLMPKDHPSTRALPDVLWAYKNAHPADTTQNGRIGSPVMSCRLSEFNKKVFNISIPVFDPVVDLKKQ